MSTVNTAANPASQTQAVVPAPVPAPLKRYQATLFNVETFLDQNISRVLTATPIAGKDEHGNKAEVGMSVSLGKRREIAKEMGLTRKEDKEALDQAILSATDDGFTKVKGMVAGLSKDWTLRKVATRTMGNGEEQLTIVARKVKRATGPSDEAIAKAWNCTVEEVVKMRERQTANAKPVIDVTATTK